MLIALTSTEAISKYCSAALQEFERLDTAWHSTAQYSTARRSTAQHGTAQSHALCQLQSMHVNSKTFNVIGASLCSFTTHGTTAGALAYKAHLGLPPHDNIEGAIQIFCPGSLHVVDVHLILCSVHGDCEGPLDTTGRVPIFSSHPSSEVIHQTTLCNQQMP